MTGPDLSVWAWLALTLALTVLALLMVWFSWTAGRLDRIHLRSEATMAALRQQLLRRSSVSIELATGGLSDPASALLLLEAARTAREKEPDEGWLAESDLTAALLAVELPDADAEPLRLELDDAARKVALARRIHNDVAASAMGLRDRKRVRWFRLAGHAQRPAMVEFDDRAP